MTPYHRLCLGTAQFGLDYGVSNARGKVPPDEVRAILKTARDFGVGWMDTAADYGTCEDALAAHPALLSEFKVTTKSLKYDPAQMPDFEAVRSAYVQSLEQSCQKLNRARADIYYLRSPEILFQTYGSRVTDFLAQLKEKGLIDKVGISVYEEKQIDEILTYFTPDAVQVPYNILDQRLIASGVLRELKARGVDIHARSIFLQGLFLMTPADMPAFFDPVRGHIARVHAQCAQAGISPLKAALSFILSQDVIDLVIIGVSSGVEWVDILETIAKPLETPIDWTAMKMDDERYLNPAQWKA